MTTTLEQQSKPRLPESTLFKKNFPPDYIPYGVFRSQEQEKTSIVLLEKNDISAFRNIILTGINTMNSDAITEESRTRQRDERQQQEFYKRALNNPAWTLLAMRDPQGNILGGLEAVIQERDEVIFGFVNWICVDKSAQNTGVAKKLYQEYERILQARGDVQYLMAYVSDTNAASLHLHKETMGMNNIYAEDKQGKWYYKSL